MERAAGTCSCLLVSPHDSCPLLSTIIQLQGSRVNALRDACYASFKRTVFFHSALDRGARAFIFRERCRADQRIAWSQCDCPLTSSSVVHPFISSMSFIDELSPDPSSRENPLSLYVAVSRCRGVNVSRENSQTLCSRYSSYSSTFRRSITIARRDIGRDVGWDIAATLLDRPFFLIACRIIRTCTCACVRVRAI